MTRPRQKSRRKRDSNPGSSPLEADALATRPTRWSDAEESGGDGWKVNKQWRRVEHTVVGAHVPLWSGLMSLYGRDSCPSMVGAHVPLWSGPMSLYGRNSCPFMVGAHVPLWSGPMSLYGRGSCPAKFHVRFFQQSRRAKFASTERQCVFLCLRSSHDYFACDSKLARFLRMRNSHRVSGTTSLVFGPCWPLPSMAEEGESCQRQSRPVNALR